MNILAGKSPAAQQFALFSRIIPNFSFRVPVVDSGHLENLELNSWYEKIGAGEEFINSVSQFIDSERSIALALINVRVKQVKSTAIYLVLKEKTSALELKFYNLIEIATLISDAFVESLWQVISRQIEIEGLSDRILSRNFESSYFALKPLFTLCNSSFLTLGKRKYDFGDTLFWLNHHKKWERKNSDKKANSGRVILYMMPKNNDDHKKSYSQALIQVKLEKNVLFTLK